MRTAAGVETTEHADRRAGRPRTLAPGDLVLLRRPWHLRRTAAVVRRRLLRGWEVEVRTPLGTPMHLVLPARAMRRA